jgi:hypothetical protein
VLPLVPRLRPTDRPTLKLPSLLLSRYLFFLTRRPISASNVHFLHRRIDGLQSLAPLYEGIDDPAAVDTVRLLRCLNPSNLYQVAERIQLCLLRLTATVTPRRYLTLRSPVPEAFVGGSKRIAMVLGPAIGIGDEAITFPLPSWISARHPDAEVTVVSGYPGLWDDVAGVGRVVSYTRHDALIEIMRGTGPEGHFDLVMLIDFENPDLLQALTYEPSLARYAEVSIGAQIVNAVDAEGGRIYRATLPPGSFGNVYHGFDRLVAHLGIPPGQRFTPAGPPNRHRPPQDPLTVFVSPFSSKYDPSLRYWSRLVGGLVAGPGLGRPVRFVVDPGPNLDTSRFAAKLRRNLASEGIDAALAGGHDAGHRRLTLPEVVAEIRRSDAVVCVDSFAAHLAPWVGRTTLVLPSPGLENWRVPYDGSFYFDATCPLADIVAGMRFVITQHFIGGGAAALPGAGPQFAAAARRLSAVLAAGGADAPPALIEAFEEFVDAAQAMASDIDTWADGSGAAFADFEYAEPPRRIQAGDTFPASQRGDVHDYVASTFAEWRNTNLAKHLAAVVVAEPS